MFGVALPIWEAVRLCQLEAPENWPEGAYKIIRRDDLARQVGGKFAKGDGKRAVGPSDSLIGVSLMLVSPELRQRIDADQTF